MWLGMIVVIILSTYLPWKAEDNYFQARDQYTTGGDHYTNVLSYAWIGGIPKYRYVDEHRNENGNLEVREFWRPYHGACSVDTGRYLAEIIPVILVTVGLVITLGKRRQAEQDQ